MTTRTRRFQRLKWIGLAALILVVVAITAIFVFGGRPTGINYYRVTGDRTIQIEVVTGSGTWRRVEVDETPSAVTVTVRSYDPPGIRADIGFLIELAVILDEPLGDRPVLDGRDGRVVDQTRCTPPMYAAPGCIVD